MVMNISCKFEKAGYNFFFVRAVTVKSLCTLWRQRCNEAKSIVSTGCYPVDTNTKMYNFYKDSVSSIQLCLPKSMFNQMDK